MKTDAPVAVVTGAGSGIGRAAALALARQGYAVVLAGRKREALETTASRGTDIAAAMTVVPADVTEPASVESLFSKVEEVFGRLDLLFNNAGTGAPPVLLEDLTDEQWKGVVDTILSGTFYCTREAFRIMKARILAGAASLITAPSLRTLRVPTRRRTQPPSTGLRDSPNRPRSMAGNTTSPAARSTSATRPPR